MLRIHLYSAVVPFPAGERESFIEGVIKCTTCSDCCDCCDCSLVFSAACVRFLLSISTAASGGTTELLNVRVVFARREVCPCQSSCLSCDCFGWFDCQLYAYRNSWCLLE